jgi:hypothetical protein
VFHRHEVPVRDRAFPSDPIEATTARIKYGLDGATYSRLAPRLRTWRLGNAIFHSHSELRRIIRESARFEPSGATQQRPTA